MNKSELFKIISDPACDPKYIEQALMLYSLEEILKVPAISLRSMYEDLPRSKTLDLWFKLLSPDKIDLRHLSIGYPYNLGFYLVAYYSENNAIFFSSMANVNNKVLLKRLFPKFKLKVTQTNRVYTKRNYYSLYAYDLIDRSELLETLSIKKPQLPTSVNCPLNHTLHKCENLFKRILSKSQDLDLASEFLVLERICSEDAYTFILDMASRVLCTQFPEYKLATFLDLYRKHLEFHRN
jgi:hypothetical protein